MRVVVSGHPRTEPASALGRGGAGGPHAGRCRPLKGRLLSAVNIVRPKATALSVLYPDEYIWV